MILNNNPDLKMFEDLAVNFAQKELEPRKEETDRYPFCEYWDTLDKAFEVGFLGTTLPEELGGIGQGMETLCLILERVSRYDASLAGVLLVNATAQETLIAAGKADMLGGITSVAETASDFMIGMPAFNNPTEVKKLADARKTDDGYLLDGEVPYVVLAGIAGHAIIPAAIDGGIALFLVDLRSETISKSSAVLSLGLHSCPAVDCGFFSTPAALIAENAGSVIDAVSDRMGVSAAAVSAGIMKGSVGESIDYARDRSQGGWEIINWSSLKMMLGNMASQSELADMALASAAHTVETKTAGWQKASRAAAIQIQLLACEVATNGVQTLGGYGYMKDYGQEKRFRDAKQMQGFLGLAPMKKMRFIDKMFD